MAQKQLDLKKIRQLDQPGYHSDGGGLYLRVFPGGTKTFIARFTAQGGRREITLGQFPGMGLAEARKKSKAEIKAARSAPKPSPDEVAPKRERVQRITFAHCAAKYIEAHKAEWSAKSHGGWIQTLAKYAEPVIGKMHPNDITTDHVQAILEPIWQTKTETAVRVRSRIEAVLDWAAVKRHRNGNVPNPARWKGHLEHLLADRNKVAPVKHHEALPFREIPAFIAKLRASNHIAARGMLFLILTAARSSEARGAMWGEVDLTAAEWTIPPTRMKAGKEHRVPLAAEVVAMIGERPKQAGAADLVFPSSRVGKRNRGMISNMSFGNLLDDLGYPTLTTHGFRSTFRDWAAETTDYANEVVEMALAHAIGSKVEAAYRRGNLLEKRRALMNDWTKYCMSAKVVEVASRPDCEDAA